MTIKEQLVEIIRKQGYDFVSACELADNYIKEFKASGKHQQRYAVGRTIFTLQNDLKWGCQVRSP